MEKTIYCVVCTNAIGFIICVNAFNNIEDAQNNMKKQFSEKKDDFCQDFSSYVRERVDSMSAFVSDVSGTTSFKWNIVKTELK